MTGAGLPGADFTDANMRFALLNDAVVEAASFKFAVVEKADFTQALLSMADFRDAAGAKSAIFTHAQGMQSAIGLTGLSSSSQPAG